MSRIISSISSIVLVFTPRLVYFSPQMGVGYENDCSFRCEKSNMDYCCSFILWKKNGQKSDFRVLRKAFHYTKNRVSYIHFYAYSFEYKHPQIVTLFKICDHSAW